jgi:hypothetical protein
MQALYINGLYMGKTSARRYNRVTIADEMYNDWYFAMAAGYEIKVPGMHIKRFWQTVINGETALEIITFIQEE